MLRKSDTWDKSFDKKREPESNEYISLTEKYLNFAKKVPWFWKKNLFACIFGFNFHLKFRFKSIFQWKHQNFPLYGPSLYVVHETFIELLLFQEISPVLKNFWFCVRLFTNNKHTKCSVQTLLIAGYFCYSNLILI